MITLASLSAFAAPIGPTSLGTPPLRVSPVPSAPAQPSSTVNPATRPGPAPAGAPRGTLLNITIWAGVGACVCARS